MFVDKAKAIHGDKYDYSFTNYTNSYTKVKIICKQHGIFEQLPSNHLKGRGCSDCSRLKISQSKLDSQEAFIAKITKYKPENILLDKVKYTRSLDNVILICTKHGEFTKRASKVVRGQWCPSCSREKVTSDQRKDQEEFIKEARLKHGDKYDYSKSVYERRDVKLTIICPIHGEFKQRPAAHLTGAGCKKCAVTINSCNKIMSFNEFEEIASKKFNNQYEYDSTSYSMASEQTKIRCNLHNFIFYMQANTHIKSATGGCKVCVTEKLHKDHIKNNEHWENILKENKIKNVDIAKTDFSEVTISVVCDIHGEVRMNKNSFRNGSGCPKCGRVSATRKITKTFEEFKYKANDVHTNKYTYLSYDKSRLKVGIVCDRHGVFYQNANDHVSKGYGCPKCRNSKKELEFKRLLADLNVPMTHRDKSLLAGKGKKGRNLELDFYFPEHKIAIEFNGLIWHSEKYHKEAKTHLAYKSKLCSEKGVQLIHIYEDELDKNPNEVIALVKSKLGLVKDKIYARETEVKKVDWSEARLFIKENHIQGSGRSGLCYGLYSESKLVAVAVFTSVVSQRGVKDNFEDVELIRYCSSIQVVGGASKLISYFKSQHSSSSKIISYSDNRLSDGKMYQTLGFIKVSDVPIDYYYINSKSESPTRYHKSKFTKAKLSRLLGDKYDSNKTETQICHELGLYRIWNCGLVKWELKIN